MNIDKYKIISSLMVIILLVTACGSREINTTVADDSAADDEMIEVATVTDVTTENHSLDYFDEIERVYNETIDYGEIYNKNGIIITTINYVHDNRHCYLEVKIQNNTENDITFEEKSYAVNYVNYEGNFVDYNYNDGLNKLSIESNDEGKLKLEVRDILSNLGNRNVDHLAFLFSSFDYNTKEKIDDIYFELDTSISDGIPKFVEYPTFQSDELFDFRYMGILHDRLNDIDMYQISVYNKTNSWFKIEYGKHYFNNELATETNKEFYKSNLTTDFDADYFNSGQELYIFPNSISSFMIGIIDGDFIKNNDIDDITSIKCNLIFNYKNINIKPLNYMLDLDLTKYED